MKKIFFLILFAAFFWNCATSSAGLATSNVPIVNKKYKVLGPVEESTSWATFDIGVIAFPVRFALPWWKMDNHPADKLVNKILEEKQADALINIRFWNDRIILLFISINRFGVNAEAIKFEEEIPVQVQPNDKKRR